MQRRAVIELTRKFSSPSSARPAFVLPSSSSTGPLPPPSPSATQSEPPPFIPRPVKRLRPSPRPLVESLSSASPSTTTVHFKDHPAVTVSNLFLRDSSVHPKHVHPASQQRLFRTTDIDPSGGKLIGYGVHRFDDGHGDCLITEWDSKVADTNLAVVPISRLLQPPNVAPTRVELPQASLWKRDSAIMSEIAFSQLLDSDVTLHETLSALLSHGIVFVRDVPSDDPETLARLVARVGRLRKTWYGDLWDVKAVPGSKNIAYTNLDLGLHMDLIHFENPPKYQFLHCLSNTGVTGGTSYFVDSYNVAHQLSDRAFETLSRTPMHFQYKNGGQHTSFLRPTLELDPLSPRSDKRLAAVNYSPPFQGALPMSSCTHELHSALTEFATLAGTRDNVLARQLERRDCVVFDNRRVLHARTAFEVADGGERWLKGAYADAEELGSKWRVLEETLATSREQ